MKWDRVECIANAVLYEGYMLYPYRPSVKNRQRWTFGGLLPRSYCEAQAEHENWAMQTECLVEGTERTTLEGAVRFLHVMARRMAKTAKDDREYQFVETLQVGETVYQSWQEAVEREVAIEKVVVHDLVDRPRRLDFTFPSSRTVEKLSDANGKAAGFVVREQKGVSGTIELSAALAAPGLYRINVRIENHTECEPSAAQGRDDALLQALVSTHTVLGVTEGAFVSLLEPPPQWRELASACRNVGTWPVLVGAAGDRDTLLSAPIILYDYPQVAAESPGDLFDGTEIDEILTLRILTLTDDEKRLMAAVDDRAHSLLQRTESLSGQDLLNLHGTVRMLQPLAGGEHHG